jgi:hypothetical protein
MAKQTEGRRLAVRASLRSQHFGLAWLGMDVREVAVTIFMVTLLVGIMAQHQILQEIRPETWHLCSLSMESVYDKHKDGAYGWFVLSVFAHHPCALLV